MTVLSDDLVVEGDGFVMFRTDDDGWQSDDPDIWKVTP